MKARSPVLAAPIRRLKSFIANPSYQKLIELQLQPEPSGAAVCKYAWAHDYDDDVCDLCPANGPPFVLRKFNVRWCFLCGTSEYIDEEEYQKIQGEILLTIIQLLAYIEQGRSK